MLERTARSEHGANVDARASAALPLSVRNLSLEIEGHRLLDGIAFDVSRHGVTLVMGPNGAGKSLLIRILHGLQPATSGDVLWNDVPVGGETRALRARWRIPGSWRAPHAHPERPASRQFGASGLLIGMSRWCRLRND